jgi:glycosyltransferase involved in cell wall biosynthesis
MAREIRSALAPLQRKRIPSSGKRKRAKVRVILLAPSLTSHDAVSNEVILQADVYRTHGISVGIYADKTVGFSHRFLLTREEIEAHIPHTETLWIYYHSIEWQQGELWMKKIAGSMILRYHGITPPSLFIGHSSTQEELKRGIAQTVRVSELPHLRAILPNSLFMKEDLLSLTSPACPIHVIAPFHQVEETVPRIHFHPKTPIQLLFVGRFSPNKGHENLLLLAQAYRKRYGKKQVTLHLAGKGDRKFLRKLYKKIMELDLVNTVEVHYDITPDFLVSLYRMATLFVSMSEHEGFGLPLLEAQYHGVPVFTLDRGACKETVGKGGWVFSEVNLSRMCESIHELVSNPEAYEKMVLAGRENFQRYRMGSLKKQFWELTAPSLGEPAAQFSQTPPC